MAKAKKLPSGNWRVQVFVGIDEEKKRQYHSVTAPTKKEAEYLAAEFALKHKDKRQNNLTVKEALERYTESKKNVLSPSTYREYKNAAQRDLKELHNVKLSDLTQERVQIAINNASMKHSPKTVKNMHGLLSSALKMFMPELRLTTTLPRTEKKQLYIPSDEDIKKLLNYVKGKPIELPILLAATGSLRRSEISALTPEDVKDNGVVINKAMVLDIDHKWVVKPPKTRAGNRFCPLSPAVAAKAREGLPTLHPDAITHHFKRAVKNCGLPPFSFHKLRHYYASVLHALGVPDKYIMKNGGWECESVLHNVYEHTLSDREDQEAQKIVTHFSKFDAT